MSRKWWICDSISSCVICAEKHDGSVVGSYIDSHSVAVKGSLCKAGKWVSKVILSNQESSLGSAVSPSAKARQDKASGPLCLSAGTCTRVKSKRRIP